MKESGKERFIITKSYEIAYALFRLAAPLKEADFAERLRAAAAGLLSDTVAGNYGAASSAIRVMESLVKFAGDANLVGVRNADLVLREIYALDAAIAERRTAPVKDEVDVAEIFSGHEAAAPHDAEPSASGNPEMIYPATEKSGNPAIAGFSAEQTIGRSSAEQIEPSVRQSAILKRIRQSGNCRMKDILDLLPDTSERTIRYDLQTLLEQNLIERVGTAGPSVFYRTIGGTIGG